MAFSRVIAMWSRHLPVAIIGKIVVVALSSTTIGERSDTALNAGFAMAQVGPMFAYLIADVAKSGGTARTFLCSLAVAVSTHHRFPVPLSDS